jgi:hypothetical protein
LTTTVGGSVSPNVELFDDPPSNDNRARVRRVADLLAPRLVLHGHYHLRHQTFARNATGGMLVIGLGAADESTAGGTFLLDLDAINATAHGREAGHATPDGGRLRATLRDNLLARLLDIPRPAIDRLALSPHAAPSGLAMRAAALVQLVDALSSNCNTAGVREWFDRPLSELGGDAPAVHLTGSWAPDSASIATLLEIARRAKPS